MRNSGFFTLLALVLMLLSPFVQGCDGEILKMFHWEEIWIARLNEF
jgi:hypothetical protein